MSRTIRIFLLASFTALVCVACAATITLVAFGHAPNSQLNPLQAIALRVSLRISRPTLLAPAGSDPTTVKFVIHKDDLPSTIGANLAAQGLIRDADLFRSYVRFYGIDANLQAGTYLLSQTQTIPQIAQALTNSGTNNTSVLVKEGWRIEQIAEAINADHDLSFSGADFLAVVGTGATPPAWFTQSIGALPSGASLEGFLFPDTYLLPLDTTATGFRDALLKEFDQHLTPQMRLDAAQSNLSIAQIVTLASIVEREAVVSDERPLIAGVYLNRFRKPMTLDADPTVQYPLGKSGDWWPQITAADYQSVQSPYNTYLHSGLPPTPIANPGLSSLMAAIYPRASTYFYFRASCKGDGRHNFATTFAEQEANAC